MAKKKVNSKQFADNMPLFLVSRMLSDAATNQLNNKTPTGDNNIASSEEKDCPCSNLDTSKDSKSGEDSSSENSSKNESDGKLEGSFTQAEEWKDKKLPTDHFIQNLMKSNLTVNIAY